MASENAVMRSYKNDAGEMTVVAGKDFDDFYQNLNSLFEGDLDSVNAVLDDMRVKLSPAGEAQDLQRGAQTVRRGFRGGNGGQQQRGGQRQQQQSSPPGQQAPICEHGVERVYKSGTGSRGPWAAWFCNGTKNRNEQCPPEWVDS